MHQVLSHCDILSLIFQPFADQIDYSEGWDNEGRPTHRISVGPGSNARDARTTLLYCALTCRVWKEPALDALWKTLDSLHPLFKLISCFEVLDDSYMLRGAATDHELKRCRFYNHRIRNIIQNRCVSYNSINTLAYAQLARMLGSPILPFLRVLKWSSPDVLHLWNLIGPTLEVIEICLEREADRSGPSNIQAQSLDILLREVIRAVPDLRTLRLQGMVGGWPLECLHRFQNLKTVAVAGTVKWYSDDAAPSISHGNMVMFSRMDKLTYLCLNVYNIDVPSSAKAIQFMSLRSISLGGPMSKLAAVLVQLCPTHLQTITVHIHSGEPVIGYEALFRTFGFPSLQHLTVSISRQLQRENRRVGAAIAASTFLSAVLGCRELRTFQIVLSHKTPHTVLMDNNDLTAMARAWPHLTKLCWPFNLDPSRFPTIDGLKAFVDHCPNLHTLKLAFSTHVPFSLPKQPSHLQHKLRILVPCGTTFGSGSETAEIAIAQWVYLLFPLLHELGTGGRDAGWKKVFAMVKAFQRKRSVYEQRRSVAA